MSDEIAIIGLAGRFPGAADVPEFWRNLRAGTESITFLAESELEISALVPERMRKHPDFVPAAGVLADADLFDHPFFGMSLREAKWTDPQQRIFLQLAWAALEDAGIDAERVTDRISVYAGAANSGHLLGLLSEVGDDPASLYEAMSSASSENLATKVAYALRLRGEAVTMHTACSTGLTVVHAACQSLLLGQSSVALAGSVRIAVPQRTGYVYQEGMILSRDGHCRPFDAAASGTVPGNGAGVVVLKMLDAAIEDRDHVYAVVKGTAINNDGHRAVSYTAPSSAGQAEVIAEALEFAGVTGKDIGYVEAHGTGTPLGDPIEIAALTRAYGAGDCGIGSVKSNIGHLDAAAGIAGLIKVALSLHHSEIPPTLQLRRANPAIDFAASPFTPVTDLTPWPRDGGPRLAGVSSFGIGGTNVHAVLEEAPVRADSTPSARPHQLVTLSARTESALATMAGDLADFLENDARQLADVAYTRAVGRSAFPFRRTVAAADVPDLIATLRKPAKVKRAVESPVVFLFPGQGAAFRGVAIDLYDAEPAFRQELDAAVAALQPHLAQPLLSVLLTGSGPILDPELSHPAIFAMEYALARLWLRWGVRPQALLGHSFGEYAAACVAGVWSLPDAARLAAIRGQLVARMAAGAMLAVGIGETAALSYVDDDISLAAVNSADRCVFSGTPDAVAALKERLSGDGIASVLLPVSYAFHSPAVEPILAELGQTVVGCPRSEARLPLISSLTGTWWTAEDGGPDYWARQMREPVRFADGLRTAADREPVFLEVGPDQALTALARTHLRAPAVPSLPRPADRRSGHRVLLDGAGALWRAGVSIDWDAFYEAETRRREPLPSYPFDGVDCRLDATYVPAQRAEPVPEADHDTVEEKVFAIWRDRLGTDDFGIHDNFLELGGNSLMAAQLLTRLREAFSVQLPLAALFDTPTVAGVAQHIRALSGDNRQTAEVLPPLRPMARDAAPPLSVVQERTLALEAADPGNPALLMPIAVTMDGPLDVDALQLAATKVIARHETLRTTFHRENGEWVQRIGDPRAEIGVEESAADPTARARAEAVGPIDLAVSPIRLTLLRQAQDRHILLFTLHHVVSDTWSMVVFLRELATAYAGATLPPVDVQYADFAAWQRQNLRSGALSQQLGHWRDALDEAPPPLPLPTDRSRALESGYRASRIGVELSADLSNRITAFCQRAEVTPFVAILAAYTALLARISGSDDIVVGTPVGNRERPELEALIGYVAHCLPLRTTLHDDPTFVELVQRVKATLFAAYEYPDVPYEYLATERPARLFSDAAFVLHSGIDGELTPAGMTWRLWDVPDLPAQFGASLSPLTLMLAARPDGFTGALEYAADLFTEDTAHRLVGQLRAILDAAVQEPRTPVSHLDLAVGVGS